MRPSAQKFTVIDELGSDHRGALYRVADKKTGQRYLVRAFDPAAPFYGWIESLDLESINYELAHFHALQHPNIAFIRRFDRDAEGVPYLVMDDHPGSPMQTLQPLQDVSVLKTFVQQLCDALNYLHLKGIYHLDIRPETLLVDTDHDRWSFYLLDGGLSFFVNRLQEPIGRFTGDLTALRYQSPEMLAGRSVDGRTDLYSFGTVLYEAITGHHPCDGSGSADILSKLMNEKFAPCRPTGKTKLNSLCKMVDRLVAKEPGLRPKSAREIAACIADNPPESFSSPLIQSPITDHPLPRTEILNAFTKALSGHASVVTLWGEPGIGKTRLLREAASEFRVAGTTPLTIRSIPFTDTDHGIGVLKAVISQLLVIKPDLAPDLIEKLYHLEYEDNHLYLSDDTYLDSMIHRAALELHIALSSEDAHQAAEPCVIILENCHFTCHIFWKFWVKMAELAAVSPRHCPCLWIIETNSPVIYPTVLAAPRFHSLEALAFDQSQTTAMLKMLSAVDSFPEPPAAWIHDLSKGIAGAVTLLSNMAHYTGAVLYHDHRWRIDAGRMQYLSRFDNLDVLIDWFIANRMSREEIDALTFLSLWPDGCPIDQFKTFFEFLGDEQFARSGIGVALAYGWIERDLQHGSPVYKFANERFRARIYTVIPAYKRHEFHQELASQLLAREPIHPAVVSEHFFLGDNRLHGCDWALTAARYYRKTGAFHQAIRWHLRNLKHMPDRNRTKIAGANFELAQVLILVQEFDSALKALVDAEPILESRFYQKRDSAHYFLLMGICRFMLKDRDSALKNVIESLDYLPKTTAFDHRLKIMMFYSRMVDTPEQIDELMNLFNSYQKRLPLQKYPYFSGVFLEWIANTYFDRQLPSSGEYFLKESISCGEQSNDIHAVIHRRYLMGLYFEKAWKHKPALSEFEVGIILSRKFYTSKLLCYGLCHTASLLMEQHTYESAENLLIEACEISDKYDDPVLKIRTSVLYSHFLIESGRIDHAERLLIEAESLLDDRSPFILYHPLYTDLAVIARRRGNPVQILEIFTKLFERARQQDNVLYIMLALMNVAEANCRLRNYKQAEILLNEVETLLEKLNMKLPDTDMLRAWIYFLQGETDAAYEWIQKGLVSAKREGLIRQQANAYKLLGMINLRQSNFDAALADFKQSLGLFITRHDELEIALIRRLMAEVYYSIDQTEAAEREIKTANSLYKKLGADILLINRDIPGIPSRASSTPKMPDFQLKPVDISDLIQSLVLPDQFYTCLLRLFVSSEKFPRALLLHAALATGNISVQAGDADFTSREIEVVIHRHTSDFLNKKMPLILSFPIEDTNVDQFDTTILRTWIVLLDHNAGDRVILYLEDGHQSMAESKAFLYSVFSIASSAVNISRRFQACTDKLETPRQTDPKHDIIARSREMAKVIDSIAPVAYSTLPALIIGSQGTGKSFIIQHIHQLSIYRAAPLVVITCETLGQAERTGVIVETILSNLEADDSVGKRMVVLDHIEALNKIQQADVLELLTKTIHLVGHPLSECRFLFTSAENLVQRVQQDLFDLPLYKAISNLMIRLPDLVERKQDIPLLANMFLEKSSVLMKKPFTDFSPEALEALINYTWPGNISELESAVESAVLFGIPPTIMFDDLPKTIRIPVERSGVLEKERLVLESMEDIEEAHIRSVLQTTKGNKLRASALLGISRPTLDRKLEKFGIVINKKRKR